MLDNLDSDDASMPPRQSGPVSPPPAHAASGSVVVDIHVPGSKF